MSKNIAIIGSSISNLKSICSAIQSVNLSPKIIHNSEELHNFDKLILPGVGTFKEGMKFLRKNKLEKGIIKFIEEDKKVMAICLGMQLLLEKGYEFGEHNGLGVIKGSVRKLKSNNVHLGWNWVKFKNKNQKDFFAYFVHSYFTDIKNKNIILGETLFNKQKFVSYFRKNNLMGCQFHPEKSGKSGLELIEKFFNEKEIKKI